MEPRPSCSLCALKHIAQARALALECRKGYAQFFIFALGHLAEAEDELVVEHAELGNAVRDVRKQWESSPTTCPPFDSLVLRVMRETGYDLDSYLASKNKGALFDKREDTSHIDER